jgi:hypothetical protein
VSRQHPDLWDPIDHLLALDPGRRGIGAFFTPGAARAAAHAIRGARRVLITTGFTVAADAPETDGPPGAAVLGRALRRLGIAVRYITDPATVPVLDAALTVVGEPADILVYPEGDGVALALLRRERPTHLVAIERPGRSRGGDYLNARGASVAAWNRPIDELFLCIGALASGSNRGWPARGTRGSARPTSRVVGARGSVRPTSRVVTVGVGDGGNEIGMGNVGARLRRLGPLMARIAAVVSTDHLVVAGVSNWGAYGIAAALGQLTGQALLHTPEVERRLIEACVAAGAVDGLSRRREATVDGLGLDVHAAFVRLLHVAGQAGSPADSGIIDEGQASRAVSSRSTARSLTRRKATRT